LFRAVRYTVRRRSGASVALYGAAEPCWVPEGAEGTYRRVRRFLDAAVSELAVTRLRLVTGARPEVQIIAASTVDGRDSVRTLSLSRYVDDALARGFAETV
jgi:hypothetical protein